MQPKLCVEQHFAILRITPALTYTMIRCHLSSLMGREKLRISDVSRLTGLNRSTVAALYREQTTRIEISAIEQLCVLFKCSVGDLLQHVPDDASQDPA